MILGQPFGEDRVPFERPASATPTYMPGRMQTGFIPEFQAYPQIMPASMARMPGNVRLPAGAMPGGAPSTPANAVAGAEAATAAASMPAVAAKIKRGGGGLPVHMLMAMGVMPGVRGVRSGLDPDSFVASGRKPNL